ncbi:MAG TPA: hypothetical protein VFK97_00505 [Candidatus Saccharimonadales bacterium]|nr:hypothetical protein [Candidatus Saccharimonadales bacterium]
MNTSNSTAKKFIDQIEADYPQFKFKPGNQEHWSPRTKTITYELSADSLKFGLLHELAHALLGHDSYRNDFELVKLESQAWHKAAQIGRKYGVKISEDHIQNCLDTYRDWLHRRSKCPACGTHTLQANSQTYACYNCGQTWRVSAGRFARSYRRRT